MQDRIEAPPSIADLADGPAITARQLERLFLRYVNSGPARTCFPLRFDRAQELIRYSDRSILDAAVAPGTSLCSQWFRRLQGVRRSGRRTRSGKAAQ